MGSTSPYITKTYLQDELKRYEARAEQDANQDRAEGMQIIISAIRDRFDLPEPDNNG